MDQEKHAEFLQAESQFSISAVNILIFGLAVQGLAWNPQYRTVVTSNTQMVIGYLFILGSIISVYLREQRSLWNNFARMKTCIFSTFIAITAYAQLLIINASYIIGSPVLLIIVFFIVVLWTKFREKDDPKYSVGNVVVLMFITLLPYNLLWSELLMGDRGSSFVLSHFLLFLSSALGAVAVMVSRLAVAATPAAAQVLQLLHKTCTVVLTVTVHTMAAERLGEDMVLACMPQLIAVLRWFTIHSDHAGYMVILYRLVRSQKSALLTISSASAVGILAILISMYGNDSEILASLYSRALGIFGFSAALSCFDLCEILASLSSRALGIFGFSAILSFFDLCMLRQWPGSLYNSKGPIQLLQVSVRICSSIAAMMTVMTVLRCVIDRSTVLRVTTVMAALLLAVVVWTIVYKIELVLCRASTSGFWFRVSNFSSFLKDMTSLVCFVIYVSFIPFFIRSYRKFPTITMQNKL